MSNLNEKEVTRIIWDFFNNCPCVPIHRVIACIAKSICELKDEKVEKLETKIKLLEDSRKRLKADIKELIFDR